MSLYPTLEDLTVGEMAKAQQAVSPAQQALPAAAGQPSYPAAGESAAVASPLYPSLDDYMGMALTPYMQQGYQIAAVDNTRQVGVRMNNTGQMQVAPLTGNDLALRRAEVKQGIRQVRLCKDQSGKVGLRIRHVNKGVFICFVSEGSVAAMAGLRFGDQILQINNETVAGWDTDKVHKFIKKADGQQIDMNIRDRPFERTITMHKDSGGVIGFQFKHGKITAIAKDSSAARNGVLIDHQLTEVGGQNVVGLSDEKVMKMIIAAPSPVTITFMPTFVYDHIMKNIGMSLVKKGMDHSVPEI